MNLIKQTITHLENNPSLIWTGKTLNIGSVESEAYKFALSELNKSPSRIDNLAGKLFIDDVIEERGEEINQQNRAHYIAESVSNHDALSCKRFANS